MQVDLTHHSVQQKTQNKREMVHHVKRDDDDYVDK